MVRRYVTHLLCYLPPEAAHDVLPILETQLSVQTDPIVRAEIFADGAAFINRQPLISLPLLSSFVQHAVAIASDPEEDRRVRFAAALAALNVAPHNGDGQLIQIVVDGVADPKSVVAKTEEELSPTVFEPSGLFPEGFVLDHAEIAADILVDDVTRTFARLSSPQREAALLRALERVGVPDHAHTLGVMILGLTILGGATYETYQGRPELRGDTLLYATVGPEASDGIAERIYPIVCSSTEFAMLTPPQRQAIAAVVRTDALWEVRSNLFAAFGLPLDRAALQALVG
ncbi:MAG: hypothetical protein H0T53_15030 [Herpetosiphonaceae bacterium]|nr:hypothetical protein [Herpetosiphonaceae bacterium]